MKHAIILLVLAGATTAVSANSLVAPGPRAGIAKSRLSAAPVGEWNRLSLNAGKNTEIWTLDGDALNKVTFFGGIAAGAPLVREVNKKSKPLPKVAANMLLTDIPTLLESTYRSQGSVVQMTVVNQEPSQLGKHKAIRFTYNFTRRDEVDRKGEATGALVGGKLYLITYEAPALYFFDKDLEKYRLLASTFEI